jgi:lipopolysaccharide transport system ATP-binding protein
LTGEIEDSPMSVVITVEQLSKQYQIGHAHHTTTLREALADLMKLAFLRNRSQEETIWALRDVSFSIERGETVGIIGRNGAGKSTLLKILSKITHPTSGEIKVSGRVAALLEVGTGFHQELTGRENIYMNGSILGMRKKEVDRKMDAIVEFSGVEKFLDTPIKRYSSGMRLRLGFSVAAHLDPDILIVDEVLAVGDAAFQKKCLNTMENLRAGARTVLFVSHNLAAVENLCRRCIWIDGGQVRMDGETRGVIKAYMGSTAGSAAAHVDLDNVENRRGNGKIQFHGVEFLSPEGTAQRVIRAGDPVVMRFHYLVGEPIPHPSLGFRMYTDMGTLVTETSTWHHGINIPLLETGEGYIDLEIDCLNLLPAKYALSLWATDDGGTVVYDNVECGVTLEVETANIYQSGKDLDSRCGIVFFPQKWNLAGTLRAVREPAGHAEPV